VKRNGILLATVALTFTAVAGAQACPGPTSSRTSIRGPIIIFSQANVQSSSQNANQSTGSISTSGNNNTNGANKVEVDFSRQRQTNVQVGANVLVILLAAVGNG
jgi:hypothetical protein